MCLIEALGTIKVFIYGEFTSSIELEDLCEEVCLSISSYFGAIKRSISRPHKVKSSVDPSTPGDLICRDGVGG